MFGTDAVLAVAKHLLEIEGIEIEEGQNEVTYVHFMCEDHEIIFTEGAPSEPLYLEEMVREALCQEALDEIFQISPELKKYAASLGQCAT